MQYSVPGRPPNTVSSVSTTQVQQIAADPILPVSTLPVSTLFHLHDLFTRVPSQPTSPAFTYSPGSFITYDQFTRKLKTLLTKAGYNADLYSGHSFRRGGASFLHACGGSALQVQAAGDWSSGCFTRYLFLSTEARLQAQLLMARNINSLCPSS